MSTMLSHPFSLPAVIIAWVALAPSLSLAASGPDRIIFKNGRELAGIIVNDDADSVTLRRKGRDEIFERAGIRRIDDTATTGAYFAASSQLLPPWKAIVNDLRTNEGVHRLRLVSTGREMDGTFASVPCVVFEMNDSIDLRIYGDPKNPAGLQLGLRGGKAGDRSEREALRAFFAGFLTHRKQIAALYALKMDGGEMASGDLCLAFGVQRTDPALPQWWLAAWSPAAVRDARCRDLPFAPDAIHGWENGFQRDRDGNIRPLLPSSPTAALSP